MRPRCDVDTLESRANSCSVNGITTLRCFSILPKSLPLFVLILASPWDEIKKVAKTILGEGSYPPDDELFVDVTLTFWGDEGYPWLLPRGQR